MPSAQSYVTCLAAHPEHPALVAGGLFSGEVGVWDVSEGSDEPQVAVSPTGTADMKEPVAAVRSGSSPRPATRVGRPIS